MATQSPGRKSPFDRFEETGASLRRRVLRCRKQIEKLATNAGSRSPLIDDVIENHQWRGYRLNPDVVRIVAIAELTYAGS